MTRQTLKATDSIPLPSGKATRPTWLRMGIAVGWAILFCVWFHSFGLPNNPPLLRRDIWQYIPWDLLDLIDPPPAEPGAAPWSWRYLGQRVPFALIAFSLWIGSISIGRLSLRALWIRDNFNRAERLFYAGCLGFSATSLIVLGLGLMGLMSRWPLLVVLVLATAAEAWFTWKVQRRKSANASANSSRHDQQESLTVFDWMPWTVLWIVSLFVFCILLGAMSPQTDFDVIEYHLGGPKEWMQAGRISRLPHNVYTSFPFLTEMLILGGMILHGDWRWGALGGQAAIAGFAPLVAIGLYGTCQRWFSTRAGWLAVLIWLTTPWAYRISIIAYAEGGLACYLLAAFAATFRILWTSDIERPKESSASGEPQSPSGLYLLIGLLAGSAMSCKYTGLISVVIPVALLILWVMIRQFRQSRQLAVYGLALYGIGVVAAVGPWLVKNTVETGNPVFPLAYSVFGGEGRDAQMDAQWRRGHSRHYDSRLDQLRDLPVKVTDVVANNDWHSALMFAMAPVALLAIWRRKVWWLWGIIGWQFLTWFLLTHQIDRFYVPMFPIVALIAGCGACWMLSFQSGRWCCLLLILANVPFNAWIMQNIGGYNSGRTDLRIAFDIATSPPQRWLNEEQSAGRLPRDFKVLCVGEAALFHAQFPYVYNTVFDRSLFQEWCAEQTDDGKFRLKSPDTIRATFREHGVTHVFVNWSEILRYREPGSYGYTDFAHPDSLAALQAAGVLGPPVPLPEAAYLMPISESKRKQMIEFAPQLEMSTPSQPYLRAYQLFPVRR